MTKVDKEEPIIKVLWLSGPQARAYSGKNFQYVALAAGEDCSRYLNWVADQSHEPGMMMITLGDQAQGSGTNLAVCFCSKDDDEEFNKSSHYLAMLFKATWQDKHWKNGLETISEE